MTTNLVHYSITKPYSHGESLCGNNRAYAPNGRIIYGGAQRTKTASKVTCEDCLVSLLEQSARLAKNDHADSNDTLDHAFRSVLGRPANGDNALDCKLWNETFRKIYGTK